MPMDCLSFASYYQHILHSLLKNPKYISSPRGLKIHENLYEKFTLVDPLNCLYDNQVRSTMYSYIYSELYYYYSRKNDLSIAKFAPFWKQIANPDDTINSAYGNLVFNVLNNEQISQIDWCIQSLIKDKETRQAVIHFNRTFHQDFSTKDFPCTMYMNFHIRNEKLYASTHMRSQDVIKGMPTDVPFFVSMQTSLLKILQNFYPNLTLGTYTHIMDSVHLYENDFALVESMLTHPFINRKFERLQEYEFFKWSDSSQSTEFGSTLLEMQENPSKEQKQLLVSDFFNL